MRLVDQNLPFVVYGNACTNIKAASPFKIPTLKQHGSIMALAAQTSRWRNGRSLMRITSDHTDMIAIFMQKIHKSNTSSVRFLLASYTAVNSNIAQCVQKILNWQQLCHKYFVWTWGALGMDMDGFESTFNLLQPLGCCPFQ